MGASGANSTPAFFARLFNATLGTKMKVIPGYPGQNDALVAMERGELDGYPSVFYSALSSTRPTWLADGTARAIVQYGPDKLPQLDGVPFAPDLVSGADKLLLEAAFAPLSIGRPLLMPPGVPAERVAALRQALAETFADPEFLAEGEKIGLSLNDPRSGEELLRVIERAYAMPPDIVARLRKLTGSVISDQVIKGRPDPWPCLLPVTWSARRRRPWRLGRPATTAPGTPMAPMILPSTMTGMPPSSGVMSLSASSRMPAPPAAMASSSALLGRLNSSAVRALPSDTVVADSCALSTRWNMTMLPPLSRMVMATCQEFLAASSSAAAMARLAWSSVIGGP